MTDAINFFQSFLLFRNFTTATANKHEIKLAVLLKMEAEKLALTAGKEVQNGHTARALVLAAAGESKIRSLTEIALWHYGHAAEQYMKSAQRFQEAARINTGKTWVFNAKAQEMMRLADEAVEAFNLLKNI